MSKLYPIPFPVLCKLLGKEEKSEVHASFSGIARDVIPALLLRDDFDSAEKLLDLAVAGSAGISGSDYAAFMYLRGKLDAAIARFETQFEKKGKPRQDAATVLVFLYRVKGDWKSARRVAESAENRELTEMLLWEASDWKALSDLKDGPRDAGNRLGVMAAYARLAGETAKFDELVEDIRKAATNEAAEDFEIRQGIDALLLNGKTKLAIEIIVDRKRELGLGFDLLCAQMKHKEAFALVDEARQKGTELRERHHIEIRRAKMLYQLGEKDAAKQLFGTLVNNLDFKHRQDFRLAHDLIKTEARLGLSDLVVEHAAKCLDGLTKAGLEDNFQTLIEPIFGEDGKLLALAWWNLMRQNAPNDDVAIVLKRVRDIMKGKLDPKLTADWLKKMEAKADREGIKGEEERFVMPRNAYTPLWAIAQAYRALKNDEKAEIYLKRSAEATPAAQGWIRFGDFLMDKKRYKEAAESYARAVKKSQQGVLIVGDPEIDMSFLDNLDNPALATYLQGRALKLAGNEKEGNRLIDIAHWLPLGNEEVRAKLMEELGKRDWPEMVRKEAYMVLKTGWYKNYTIGNVLSQLARESAKEKHFFKAASYYERCLVGCLRTGATFVEPTAYLIVPESVRVHRARGLLGEGKWKEALAQARDNLEVMPGNVEVAIKLVPELEKQGKKKEADAIYNQVKGAYDNMLKKYPNSSFGHNSVAWVMANCSRDLDDALKHSQKAVELEPESAGYLDTLAEINFRKGNRDKALELMKKCSEMDKNNGYYRRQLERFKNQPFNSPTPDEEDE